MKTSKLPSGAGALLLADFQTVITGMAMSQFAASEAERSENELMNQLAMLGNGGYLSPGSIAPDNQDGITKDSLNVHVKKVQAKQLADLSIMQLTQLVQQARPKYVGHRAIVTPLNYKNPPIEAVWYDDTYGYRTAPFKKQRIIGNIEDVRLDENLLILRPSLQRRWMTPGLQKFFIYIIDPEMLTPLVKIDIV